MTMVNTPLNKALGVRSYPQISNCGKIATKGGGKNGEKELQVMDNIRCVLGCVHISASTIRAK